MRLANYVTQETDEDGDVYYLVPSDSSDAIHEVALGDRPTCSCIHGIHWRYAGARCYHVRAAIAFRDGKETIILRRKKCPKKRESFY
jgi:hypothetical protein